MTCEELRDHYELYALGIAEDPERGEIRDHLNRNCPTCVPGVRNARSLVALIGAAAPAAEPPARLRKRVIEIDGGRPARRLNWAPVWAAVAAGAMIAAVVFNFREHRTAAQLGRLQARAATQTRELARLNEAFAILNQPGAKQVVFGGAAPRPPRGRVFLDPQRGVLLIASNLPPAPTGKTYEMWIIPKGNKPVPAGLFQSAADGTAINVQPGPVDVTSTVAVTVEPAAGVDQPTSTPIIAAAGL